jgi:dynein heavy chain
VRDWNIQGLPADTFSTENGVLITRGSRFPLLVDPQRQASKWLKKRIPALKVVDPYTEHWTRVLETAVQMGHTILVEVSRSAAGARC